MAKAQQLFDACKRGNLDAIKKLVKSKAVFPMSTVDERNNDLTPLHYAAEKGHLKIVQYLVDECHCDVNAVDRLYKKTPLHYAAEKGHMPVVEFLVSKKDCSFDVASNKKLTAQQYASKSGHGGIAFFLAEHARKDREAHAAATNALQYQTNKTVLDDSNFASLCEQLGPHASNWKTVGMNLGFSSGDLGNIESTPSNMTNAPKSYLNDLLDKWLKREKPLATLEDLKVALRKIGLGRMAAALTA